MLVSGYKKDQVGEVFIRLTSHEFIVPSLMHLIALKLHAIKCNPQLRTIKDLPDIISLIKINKVDPITKEFKEFCLKYGTDDVYRKIIGDV